MVLLGPGAQRLEVILLAQLAQRKAPIVADGAGLFSGLSNKRGQVGPQIVAAPLLEFGEEVGSPIRVVDFQRVAEDGVGRRLRQRLQQRLAYRLQMPLNGGAV